MPARKVKRPGASWCSHWWRATWVTPALAVIDGNPGLHAALRAQWPEIAIQRCTNRKLRNLLAKVPAHLREELAEDYRRMVYAETREALEHARFSFLRQKEE